MDLWQGTFVDFSAAASAGAIAAEMTKQWVSTYGTPPGESELRSWQRSLRALSDAIGRKGAGKMGVVVRAEETARLALPGVVLEYHLPLDTKRIDVVLTGNDGGGQARALLVELKQWSSVALEDGTSRNVVVRDREHLHPSDQVLGYSGYLTDYHEAFATGRIVADASVYCHELAPADAAPLRDARFSTQLEQAPLFVRGDEESFASHVRECVGYGDGKQVLREVVGGRFRPSQRVLDRLQKVLDGTESWQLLDEQRLAFNAILAEVERRQHPQQKQKQRPAVIVVRGGPGTGKTVIAVQLLAAANRRGWKAAHSTGGKAFTTALRSKFQGADGLFTWNMSLRNAAPQELDLLLVDEAHRVRETSDTRFTKSSERNRRSQCRELVDASKVTVFLLDEHQFVRPDEVGRTALLKQEAEAVKARYKEFDLAAQFRCGGCTEFTQWVDFLLGFADTPPKAGWTERYRIDFADAPEELDAWVAEARAANKSVRLLAGFCWPWSDSRDDGSLVEDVVIGSWRRPWNRKAKEKAYKPAQHPYTLWAETDEGIGQVGCIYSAQGFEFARVGVIWGADLVRRGGVWEAQPKSSFDKPVKQKGADTATLVRNAYRVLLTRGLEGLKLFIADPETRAFVKQRYAEARRAG